MPAKVITLKMPEGGAEFDVVHQRNHRCPESHAKFGQTYENDLLDFGVGVVGWQMPQGIPFMVTALGPCDACGRQPSAWFVWSSTSVFADLWTPS